MEKRLKRWHRRLMTIIAVTVLVLILALPVFAISYGVPDGDAHPFVGSMVLKWDGDLYQICSGTLIASNVYLTASHCTAWLDDFLAQNPGRSSWSLLTRSSATVPHTIAVPGIPTRISSRGTMQQIPAILR